MVLPPSGLGPAVAWLIGGRAVSEPVEPGTGAPEVALVGRSANAGASWASSPWLSTAMTVYMSMRVEKMRAWMKFRSPSSSIMIDGAIASVSAVMTPSATSPPKMLPKSRMRECDRLDELEHQLDEADEQADQARPF